MTQTLFDRVVSHEKLANTDRYLIVGASVKSAEHIREGLHQIEGAAAVCLKAPEDAVILGDLLGEILRNSFDPDEAQVIFLAFANAAAQALQGEGLPDHPPAAAQS